MLVQVENNLDKQPNANVSFVSTNLAASGTVVPVKNINGFQNNWAVQIGKTGEAQSEILNISGAPAGTALNTAGTLRYAHPNDTPIMQIHYDSVVFLRSTSGTTGTASAISTVSITPNEQYTVYNDASGAAGYAYQAQFYNSVTGDISGTSSWFTPGGPTFYSLQKLRNRLKHDLYSAGYIKDDATIADWLNEWLEIMTNTMIKVNKGYAMGTANYPFALTGGTPNIALGTITDPLFVQPAKIEITYDGVNFVPSTEIAIQRFSLGDNFSALYPRHFWQGDTVLGIMPSGAGGTMRMTNYIRYNPLVNDSDELPQIMKGYTTSFVEYGLYKAYSLDQKDESADAHYQKAVALQNSFVSNITPRDQTGIKMIELSESLSGMNEDVVLSTEYFL